MSEISEAAKAKADDLYCAEPGPHHKPIEQLNSAFARFIQEVSDAAKVAADRATYQGGPALGVADAVRDFILPEPDPLLGVVEEAIAGTAEKGAIQLREALAKRGLKIVEVGK